MRRKRSLLVGSLVLLIWVYAYIAQPPFMLAVSSLVYDVMLRANPDQIKSGDIVILDIDEESLAEYGQWPWERSLLADIVEKLAAEGAAVAAFDVIFVEEDRVSPIKLESEWSRRYGVPVKISGIPEHERDFDRMFATAITKVPVVLGCFLEIERPGVSNFCADNSDYRGHIYELGKLDHSWLKQSGNIRAPLQELRAGAAGEGFINVFPDRDNVVRSLPLAIACGGERIYLSLAVETCRLFAGEDKVGIIYDDIGAAGIKAVRIKDRLIPTDAGGSMTLNYRAGRFPRVSIKNFLAGTAETGAFKGKIVFIGTSAAAMQDMVATPLRSEYPGVEVHCTAVDNILSGEMIWEPRWMYHLVVIGLIIGGFLLALMVSRARALLSLLIITLAVCVSLVVSIWLLRVKGLLVNPAPLISGWLLIYLAVTIVKYREEEIARRKVREMFGTMVSSHVLKYLETTTGGFSLRGKRVSATVMFSDLTSFTAIAEKLAPEKLARLLNRYLSPMTEIIMANEGYVDKFEGDAVMAEWGVPFPMENHAERACVAVLEQLKQLRELRGELKSEFGHELRVRFGVNTGEMTAGNMGSEKRFQYTVMGDAVNLASRMESINKLYGTEIIIGAATADAVKDMFLLRHLDRVCVMGKSTAVEIYELIGHKGDVAEEKTRVVNLYTEALNLQFERCFDAAAMKLEEVFAIDPSDAPSRLLIERVRRYKDDPPPADWGGEYVWDVK